MIRIDPATVWKQLSHADNRLRPLGMLEEPLKYGIAILVDAEGKPQIAVDSRGLKAVDKDNTFKKGWSTREWTDEGGKFWRTE